MEQLKQQLVVVTRSATISIKKCIGRKIQSSLQRKLPVFRHLKTSQHGANPTRYDAIRHISALGQATANFYRSHLTCSIVISVQTPHQNLSDRRTVK
ncbi:hypothetical protein AVEN_226718-1 [Araneus ventricosus]|uniref:Uncharacterized protein n=1 Tax=Araneus ventricosus TaxID=182803 RepID=A0A4Y2CXL8_ARAVE|nr:hypothetical protein AVEN_226718-1 [Araneus ventricosus]